MPTPTNIACASRREVAVAGGAGMQRALTAACGCGRSYVAGRPVFAYDETHLDVFDEVPAGLVKRVVHKGHASATQLLREAMDAWEEAERRMRPDLADVVKCVRCRVCRTWGVQRAERAGCCVAGAPAVVAACASG